MSAAVKTDGVPPFDLHGNRYDMNVFSGRLKNIFRTVDPRIMATSEPTLREYQARITKAHEKGKDAKQFTDEQLWDMKFAVDGSVHPTTNEVIHPLCRMAAFVPVNIPIVMAMTHPIVASNPIATATAHWINQSYNCAVNYANRSGDAQSTNSLTVAYVAAVCVSLAGGFGTTFAMRKYASQGGLKSNLIRATLPFAAVVGSGCANVSIMRYGEWRGEGVPIMDDEGVVRGKSAIAGFDGLKKCWFARLAWNIPPMLLPPLLAIPLARIPFVAKHPLMTEATLCITGIAIGVPAALAYFKPYTAIGAQYLEEEFRDLKNSKGQPVRNFTFYKGM
jgi:tricarboxylate carrier